MQIFCHAKRTASVGALVGPQSSIIIKVVYCPGYHDLIQEWHGITESITTELEIKKPPDIIASTDLMYYILCNV